MIKIAENQNMAKKIMEKNAEEDEILESQSKQYPELMQIVEILADEVSIKINQAALEVQTEMPYKEQWILEELIKVLQERV